LPDDFSPFFTGLLVRIPVLPPRLTSCGGLSHETPTFLCPSPHPPPQKGLTQRLLVGELFHLSALWPNLSRTLSFFAVLMLPLPISSCQTRPSVLPPSQTIFYPLVFFQRVILLRFCFLLPRLASIGTHAFVSTPFIFIHIFLLLCFFRPPVTRRVTHSPSPGFPPTVCSDRRSLCSHPVTLFS